MSEETLSSVIKILSQRKLTADEIGKVNLQPDIPTCMETK